MKVLGGVRVLRGLEASFSTGEIHVIEGANGAGKSTLLALLGGRAKATHGTVSLGDRAGGGRDLRAAVGWLGHELGLYLDLTAHENVTLHARLHGVVDDPWTTWGDRLAIGHLRDRRVRDLSRGQRQRVALVRALVGGPSVLLLDEPSTGLDTATAGRLAELLLALRDDGVLVVLVTHDAAFRDRLTPRLWTLAEGRLRSAEDDALE